MTQYELKLLADSALCVLIDVMQQELEHEEVEVEDALEYFREEPVKVAEMIANAREEK